LVVASVWVSITAFGAIVVLGQEQASVGSRRESLVTEIRKHDTGLAIWWTGNNGWLIKAGGVLIGTDLVLDDQSRQHPAPISAAEVAGELAVSLVGHGHGDHFNGPTSKVLAEKSRCLFVIPQNCVQQARELGIPENRIVIARPRQPLEVKGIKIEPLRAIHGREKGIVHWEANLDDCGYLIHMGGKTILQPGDSVLLQDHLLLKYVDVLFFSPTEHDTQIDNSVTLINELEPDYILPQHRETYPMTEQNRFWTHAYTYEVQRRLSKENRKRYHVLDMGGRIEIVP
jgi:L-ascorbate metabolism protein UlaG (beta-lactamase superfamily)